MANIIGGTGDDSLTGSNSNDYLAGGFGNDTLIGGDGNDTYIFHRGDGLDYIREDATTEGLYPTETDTLVFEKNPESVNDPGITKADISLSATPNDLVLTINNDGGSIRISEQTGISYPTAHPYSGNGIEQIQFSDGEVISMADLLKEKVTEIRAPETGSDFYFDATVRPMLSEFKLYSQSGADYIVGNDSDNWIDGGDGDNTIDGGDGNDTLISGNGDDILLGGSGDDVLRGGGDEYRKQDGTVGTYELDDPDFGMDYRRGDILAGGAGSDTYFFARGDGYDDITEVGPDSGIDTLVFENNITQNDISIRMSIFNNTIADAKVDLTVNNGGGTVGLDRQLLAYSSPPNDSNAGFGIEQVQFSDGTTISMLDLLKTTPIELRDKYVQNSYIDPGVDPLLPSPLNGPIKVYGLDGNDTLTGSENNNWFDGGADNDIIRGALGNDTLLGGEGDDHLIGDGIGFRYLDGTAEGEQGSNYGVNDKDVLIGGTGNDTLDGQEGDDTYIFRRGDGNDVIWEDIRPTDTDTLVFEDNITLDDISLSSDFITTDLIITINNGGGSVNIQEQLFPYEPNSNWQPNAAKSIGIEKIRFSDGSEMSLDELVHSKTINIVDVPGETNWPIGQAPELPNVKVYGLDGDDFIGGTDIEPDWFDGGEGNDTLISMAGNDTLFGGEGNDAIYAGNDNDLIIGGPGNDSLYGDRLDWYYTTHDVGNDTYVYGLNDGADTIYELAGNDTLDLQAYRFSQVTYTGQDSNGDNLLDDLQLDFGGSNSIKVVDFFDNTSSSLTNSGAGVGFIETFIFADQTFKNLTLPLGPIGQLTSPIPATGDDDILTGTANNDFINGLAGSDLILGLEGSDTLIGGPGNDTLQGGLGNDVYNSYQLLSGNDTIDDIGGFDYLDLSKYSIHDIDFASAVDLFDSAGNQVSDGNVDSLVSSIDGHMLTIYHYFSNYAQTSALSGPGAGAIETIHFSDGSFDFNSVQHSLAASHDTYIPFHTV